MALGCLAWYLRLCTGKLSCLLPCVYHNPDQIPPWMLFEKDWSLGYLSGMGVAKTGVILSPLENITDHLIGTTVLSFILSQHLSSHDAGQTSKIWRFGLKHRVDEATLEKKLYAIHHFSNLSPVLHRHYCRLHANGTWNHFAETHMTANP